MADNLNIMFKRGTQVAFDKLTQSDVGCFYLTTDTNRLYVGQDKDKAPLLLNQTVQIVTDVDNLPKTAVLNDFYYCQEENILAVYRSDGWKQINPDNNDNDIVDVTSVAFGTGDVSDSKDSVTYTLTLQQKKTNISGTEVEGAYDDLTADLTLTSADLEAIIHDAASVGLTASSSGDNVIIETKGEGSDNSANLTLAGGTNASVKVEGTVITVDAVDTTYTLAAEENSGSVQVVLTDSNDGDGGAATFVAGEGLEVSFTDDGEIEYSHAEITTTLTTSSEATALNHEGTFSAITEVSINNGHVEGYTTTSFKLPSDTHLTGYSHEDWKTTLTDSAGNSFIVDFTTEAGELEEDLIEHITDELARINSALTYKGTVSSEQNLPTDNVEIGDVYMLSEHSGSKRIGDLFIATFKSKENDDTSITAGVIPVDYLEWTYVPSGDDLNTDTHFHGEVEIGENTITYSIAANANGDGEAPDMSSEHEDLVIAAGNDIIISEGENGEAVIAHDTFDTDTPDAVNHTSKASFTAITGLVVDNGHITNIASTTFTPETYTLAGEDNSIVLKDSAEADLCTIEVIGDDSWISATVEDNTVTISHETKTEEGNVVEVSHGADIDSADVSASPLSIIQIISGIEYDAAGHIDDISTQNILLPDNTTYDFSVNEGVNPTLTLKDKDDTETTVTIEGDGAIQVAGTATDNGAGSLKVSLVWDTF